MTVIDGFKRAIDLVKAINDLDKSVNISAVKAELQQIILDAQSAQFAMIRRIRELEEKLVDLESRNTENERYTLQEPTRGKYVLALKPECSGSEPFHWICTGCHDDGHKSIIQLAYETPKGDRYACPRCKSAFHIPLPARTFRVPAE